MDGAGLDVTALRALLSGIIDYAGLYPPASLSMAAAVAEYATQRQGPDAFMLGRFVVSASRLAELSAAAEPHLSSVTPADPWRVSALLGGDPGADFREIASFGERSLGRAVVDAVEGQGARISDDEAWSGELPQGMAAYVEVPVEADPTPFLEALAALGVRAKVRTGGMSAEAIPTTADLARFLATCARLRVPFKATAGLHHPVRSVQPFTYDPQSAQDTMHGFLNVFVAAALLREGQIDVVSAQALLEEERPSAFQFDDDGIAWSGRRVRASSIAETRRVFALSFGSCSFSEPVADLRALGLLP